MPEPIEIDVVIQAPIPVAIRWPDQDVTGASVGGGEATVILDADPMSATPPVSPVGKKIDVWMRDIEFQRRIVAYDPASKVATVDKEWSPVLDDGSRLLPTAGCPYAIEVTEIVNLPRLGTDGLVPWLDEITEERRAALRGGITRAKITGRELAAAEASVELNAKAVITDLNVPVQTPAGVRRVIQLSLAKTSLALDRQAIILENLLASGYAAVNLASRLSTLFATGERRPAPTVKTMADAKSAFPGASFAKEASPLAGSGQNPPSQTEAA